MAKKKSWWSARAKAFAPGTRGALEYYSGLARYFDPYRGPMNGQTARLEIVRELIADLGVAAIVETGSFRGVTTQWFAQFGAPVTSVEVSRRYFEFVRRRLEKYPNVQVRAGDSARVLAQMALESRDRSAATLFYLDAHWGEKLPLCEEIEIILTNYPRAVLVIDDFRVPDDAEYGFDDYGPGATLELDLVRTVARTATAFFPAVPARQETGMKRGCVVLAANPDFVARIERFPLLRRWPSVQET